MKHTCPVCGNPIRKREPRKNWSRQFEPYFYCDECKREFPVDENGKPEKVAAGLLKESNE